MSPGRCLYFEGQKCIKDNYGSCTNTACGDNVIDYGEQCDEVSANCVGCKLICGNGKIDSDNAEECDGVTGCGTNCQHLTDYTCFTNNTCTKCGNEKIDDPTEECDNGNKDGCVGCKIV